MVANILPVDPPTPTLGDGIRRAKNPTFSEHGSVALLVCLFDYLRPSHFVFSCVRSGLPGLNQF